MARYLSLDNVVAGFQDLVRSLFGIELVRERIGDDEAWTRAALMKLGVYHENGTPLG